MKTDNNKQENTNKEKKRKNKGTVIIANKNEYASAKENLQETTH